MPIKRYDLEYTKTHAFSEYREMVEDPDGEWIRYEDVAELVEALLPFAGEYIEEVALFGRERADAHADEYEARHRERQAYRVLVKHGALGELEPAGEGEK